MGTLSGQNTGVLKICCIIMQNHEVEQVDRDGLCVEEGEDFRSRKEDQPTDPQPAVKLKFGRRVAVERRRGKWWERMTNFPKIPLKSKQRLVALNQIHI